MPGEKRGREVHPRLLFLGILEQCPEVLRAENAGLVHADDLTLQPPLQLRVGKQPRPCIGVLEPVFPENAVGRFGSGCEEVDIGTGDRLRRWRKQRFRMRLIDRRMAFRLFNRSEPTEFCAAPASFRKRRLARSSVANQRYEFESGCRLGIDRHRSSEIRRVVPTDAIL
jgi:hypothetical protein